ncbi:uracil nucleotide/cysteinyl leukotriene receptor [Triplophysa rosa]|uniref:Uracil nucleotide/cysteinyl leukotriene receptor-like n=1 Tax=Triplophysa rosa TaxID=992332 RepID=A0A9W7TA44_TRIRA|nr:uracil nucleotide/cysteinyl leukotriene receptor [Triplophysa rosa]KAI7792429.1 putative uracil nucleotide/cysteinyl leukotriene receptor-like [Triplophysa rosa]
MNNTEEGIYHSSHTENILFATFYIVIFILSVPSNALALWVFCCHDNRNTPFKVFLKHLAIADVSYVLVLPMRMVYHMSDCHWPLEEGACRVVGFLFFVNLYCSMYFMTCISLDRLLACVLPHKTQNLRNTRNAKVVCAILWIMVTISMAPVLFSPKQVIRRLDTWNVTVCEQLYIENSSNPTGAVVSTAVAFLIPLVIMTVSYILVFCKVQRMTFQERTTSQRKALRLIVLTVVNFIIAFVPYHINRFVFIIQHNDMSKSESERQLLHLGNRITSALTCVSGVLDPVMYFFLAKNFQETLLQLCGRNPKEEQSTT